MCLPGKISQDWRRGCYQNGKIIYVFLRLLILSVDIVISSQVVWIWQLKHKLELLGYYTICTSLGLFEVPQRHKPTRSLSLCQTDPNTLLYDCPKMHCNPMGSRGIIISCSHLQIDKKAMHKAGMVQRVTNEVEIHCRLKHPSILEVMLVGGWWFCNNTLSCNKLHQVCCAINVFVFIY